MSESSALLQEIETLERAAMFYDGRHEFIEGFGYPDGVRITVNFTCAYDAMLLRRVFEEPPMQLAQGEFGGRVGIGRLIELFDSLDVKATIFTRGRICELYPQFLKAAAASGHEIADHMWEHVVPSDLQLEHDHIVKSTTALERSVGKRPVGSRSRHTASLLLQEG